jgi:hypothetical protein
MRNVGKFLCGGLFLALLAAPAAAQFPNPFAPQPQIQWDNPRNHGLWFFNRTKQPIYISVAYYVPGSSGALGDGTSFDAPTPGAWYVRGWYKVDPNKATQVIAGDLQERYYYFYANSANRVWSGKDSFHFIQPVKGFWYKVGSPPAVGTVQKGFRKIDTGATASGFTMTLND